MIEFKNSGDFKNIERFLNKASHNNLIGNLDAFGDAGVRALQAATPVKSGKTSKSWTYKIVKSSGSYKIEWHNTNIQNGIPIAIILQHGHGTGTGGYVQGRDYINPAMRPIFDAIARDAWEAVINS